VVAEVTAQTKDIQRQLYVVSSTLSQKYQKCDRITTLYNLTLRVPTDFALCSSLTCYKVSVSTEQKQYIDSD